MKPVEIETKGHGPLKLGHGSGEKKANIFALQRTKFVRCLKLQKSSNSAAQKGVVKF